ncbi:hypothetical protein BCR24_13510 [Enterococcus ureilyticus]|uniref:Glycine zipper family protein n=1 Tax=Enterococcus ureilyticus TaxID=1131292 RepID=A0A1E5HDY4_9ENTE|nr:hypothetical protein [Enterococcus ureilyticus]MBM7689904.1 hypothetical protein [Enterococcus ureilyticus]OEG23162.1 hypothetical protein BCR24_13510 [Enterococcus ureilyticus]
MKKIFLGSLILLVSTSVLMPFTTLAESNTIDESVVQTATNDAEKNAEIQRFTDMQNEITLVLTIKNGRYVYDEKEIKSIVDSFDFNKLATETGIEFTNESFFQEAITNIKNTKFESQIQDRMANRYNRNYYEEGWNYQRVWWDESNTKRKIIEFEDVGQYAGLAGGIGGLAGSAVAGMITGPIGVAISASIGFGVFYDGWYFSNVALNLNRIKNGTGTVYERNTWTTVYSLWTQDKYK